MWRIKKKNSCCQQCTHAHTCWIIQRNVHLRKDSVDIAESVLNQRADRHHLADSSWIQATQRALKWLECGLLLTATSFFLQRHVNSRYFVWMLGKVSKATPPLQSHDFYTIFFYLRGCAWQKTHTEGNAVTAERRDERREHYTLPKLKLTQSSL